MLHKLTTFLDDELYERFKAKAGDIPLARYLRRLIERDLDPPADEGKQ